MNLWLMLLLDLYRTADGDEGPSTPRAQEPRGRREEEPPVRDEVDWDDDEPETQREGLFRRMYEQRGKA